MVEKRFSRIRADGPDPFRGHVRPASQVISGDRVPQRNEEGRVRSGQVHRGVRDGETGDLLKELPVPRFEHVCDPTPDKRVDRLHPQSAFTPGHHTLLRHT